MNPVPMNPLLMDRVLMAAIPTSAVLKVPLIPKTRVIPKVQMVRRIQAAESTSDRILIRPSSPGSSWLFLSKGAPHR
jgi:hypothetical protein